MDGAGQMAEDPETLRARIDQLDARILDLAAERRELGLKLVGAKLASGVPVRSVERERQVIANARDRGRALGLSADFTQALASLLIEESLRGQRASVDARAGDPTVRETSVAYLGGPGSYSHFAAHAHFGDRYEGLQPVICHDFADIIRAVEEERAVYGILPIENTTTGSLAEVFDMLLDARVVIVGEHHYKVEHKLVSRALDLSQLSVVYGHPRALSQCRKFLSQHPRLEPKLVTSSTRALERAMDEGSHTAAIAGADGARLFGFNILADASDHAENYTRFIAIAREASTLPALIPSKVTVVFSTGNEPGSLMGALSAFQDEGIALTKLESRPIAGNPWEEMFFSDFVGHVDDPKVQRVLTALEQRARAVRVLGCYAADRLNPGSPA